MTPDLYARAIVALIEKGEKPKKAIDGVYTYLKKGGREKMMPHIARAFERLATREARKHSSVLYIANKSDEHRVRKESGAKDADVVVDENLIGGWRLEDRERLIDMSWKKHLLSLYNLVTQ